MTEQENITITKYDLLFESRLTRVEKIMDLFNKRMDHLDKNMADNFKEIKTNLRWLLGIIIGFGGGLMAKGFHWY